MDINDPFYIAPNYDTSPIFPITVEEWEATEKAKNENQTPKVKLD